ADLRPSALVRGHTGLAERPDESARASQGATRMGEPFRFGQFEFDSSSGELRRLDGKGPAQRLPPQPARLLGLLVERQGAVVTREEIRERLWPGTHVDFD